MARRARVRLIARQPRVVEQHSPERDLGRAHRVVGGNERTRKAGRKLPGERLIGQKRRDGAVNGPPRERRDEDRDQTGQNGNGYAMSTHRRSQNYQVVRCEVNAMGAVNSASWPRSWIHFSNAETAPGSTPAGSALRCSTHFFIAVISTSACAGSLPNSVMYACLASSMRFRPRYASPRYSRASGKPGASDSALSYISSAFV